MGKIFDALEKFGKEAGLSKPNKTRNSDYDVLMQFDASTGKIDMADPEILKDARGIKRLMTYRLINEDGTLTPAGRAKYEEMTGESKKNSPNVPTSIVEKPIAIQNKPEHEIASRFEKLKQADWNLLMNYDRKTGNLLKYDPETGQLDEESKNILQDPSTIQRLIDNQMILPGGWLTSKAKRNCARMDEALEEEQPTKSANSKTVIAPQRVRKPPESTEILSHDDMKVLLLHNPENRKLDLQHPVILKDPAILERLLDNNMIETNGQLTPQALAMCRAVTRFKQEYEQKAFLQKQPKASIGEKIKTVAAKNKAQHDAGKTKEKKLKIEIIERDEIEAKPQAVKKREIKHELTNSAGAQTDAKKPAKAPVGKAFTLGKVPAKFDNREIDKDLVVLMKPQSFEAEQFKILRTNLLFAKSNSVPRSLMVTSVLSGEGKSFIAANLAVSVAQHVNWNVLLIDCDLRRPCIHRQFGFQNIAGLSDYLAKGTDLEPLLLKTGIEKLTILPAGKPPDNPSELLSSEKMSALLAEVASRYKDRLVILDSPPPKMTAESGALARYVDGVLLVVKYGGSPKDSVTELISKLGKNKILGAVINRFDAGSSRYYKKYYGGEYFGK